MAKFKLKHQYPSENEILNAVCEYLELRHHFFFRVSNTPVYQQTGNGKGFFRKQSKYSMNGVPDIILIIDGKFIGLETKTHTGVQSLDQKIFEALCKENNTAYHIIRSIDDLIAIGL